MYKQDIVNEVIRLLTGGKLPFKEWVDRIPLQTPTEIIYEKHDYYSILNNMIEDEHEKISLCYSARQLGLTHFNVFKALYCCIEEKTSVMIFSNNIYTSNIIRQFLPFVTDDLIEDRSSAPSDILFKNGSRIKIIKHRSLSLRGMPTPDYLMITDAAFLSYSKDNDVAAFIGMTVQNGGRVFISGTPMEKKGLFYSLSTSINNQITLPRTVIKDSKLSTFYNIPDNEKYGKFID